MKDFKYSSERFSDLNNARLMLWNAKGMLGVSNTMRSVQDQSYWMGRINTYRADLRKIARQTRAQLQDRQARAGR